MNQEVKIVKITQNCFSTFSSRLIFTLIALTDFCTRKELEDWTGFSSITISRYLQIFRKKGLIKTAPGIIFVTKYGEKLFKMLYELFFMELEIAKKYTKNRKVFNR